MISARPPSRKGAFASRGLLLATATLVLGGCFATTKMDPTEGLEFHSARYAQVQRMDAFGACRNDLDTLRSDTELEDAELPPEGTGFFYLVTAESTVGEEGGAGNATCTKRTLFGACP